MKDIIVVLIFGIGLIVIGAYSHESDLIRHCKEDGKMELWHSGYELTCKINKTGE